MNGSFLNRLKRVALALHESRTGAGIGLLLEFFEHQRLFQIIASYSHGSGDRDAVLRASHLYPSRARLGSKLSAHAPRCVASENTFGPRSLCAHRAPALLLPSGRCRLERRGAIAGNHQPYPGLQRQHRGTHSLLAFPQERADRSSHGDNSRTE